MKDIIANQIQVLSSELSANKKQLNLNQIEKQAKLEELQNNINLLATEIVGKERAILELKKLIQEK